MLCWLITGARARVRDAAPCSLQPWHTCVIGRVVAGNARATGRVLGFTSSSIADVAIGDATTAYQEPSLSTDTTSHHLRHDYRMPFVSASGSHFLETPNII